MSVEILTMLFFGALLLFVMLGTPLAFAHGQAWESPPADAP